MAATYFVLLTSLGASRLASATATGTTLKLTHMGVGDGGGIVPVPDAGRTALISEKRRAEISRLSVDPKNPQQIIVEQVIPEEIGGWWIREMGLYDETGALIAYANCAPTYKPMLAEGSGRSQTIRMILAVDSTGSVELKIDPSVVLATREYVDSAIVTAMNRLDYKQSVRVATTTGISLNGLQSVDGVALAAGDRVLVKNQPSGAENGLYLAATGAWKRAADADENSEVTASLTVSVESGATQADTIWQLITDAPIVLGTTSLVFQDITNGLARLASPAFSGNPTAPTPPKFDNDTSIATTEFVQRALGGFANYLGFSTDTVLQQSVVGAFINMAAGSASYTLTLPLMAGLPDGVSITLINTSGRDNTVARQGTDIISVNGWPETSVWIKSGESATFTKGSGVWFMTGNAALFRAGSFASVMAEYGYQKLPSGLIFQWGTGVSNSSGSLPLSFPIAFPNGAITVLATPTTSSSPQNYIVTVAAPTKTGVSTYTTGAMPGSTPVATYIGVRYFAIGY